MPAQPKTVTISLTQKREKMLNKIKRRYKLKKNYEAIDLVLELSAGEDDEIVAMRLKIKACTEELQKRELEKQLLKQNIYALEGRVAGLDGLEEKKEYLSEALEKNNRLSKNIRRLCNQINPDGQSVSEIEAEAGKLSEEIKDIAGLTDALRSKADSLSKNVLSKQEVDNLQTGLNSVERERDELKARIKHTQKEIKGHLEGKEGLIREIKVIKPKLKTVRNDFNVFRDRIDLYEKNPDQLEGLKNRIPELERNSDEYLKSADNAQVELKHLNNAVDIMNTQLKIHKQAMQQIHSLLSI